MKFLQHGLFEKDFMQSKATTHSMSAKEKALGYLLGPGFVVLYTLTVSSLREMYYMQVIPIDTLFGLGSYMKMQTTTSILGVITSFLISYITEHTVSRAGRFRPYVFIGTILMCLSGMAMFWTPFAQGSGAQLAWLYVSNFFYTNVATSLYNCNGGVISLSTRSLKDRNFVTTLKSSVGNMIPGIFGSIILMGWLYFVFLAPDMEGGNWRLFVGILAVIGFFAGMVEYFWTRERITEENREMSEDGGNGAASVPFVAQIKNLLTNKWYWLSQLLGFGFALGALLQGANARTYFTQYILGANEYNGIAVIYLMIAMQPMAIGAVVVPMLTRRSGSRKILIWSSVIVLAGIAICLIQPHSMLFACLGGLIFSSGCAAVSNMYGIPGQQASDMIEYEKGYRIEGTLAGAIVGSIFTIALSPFSALYETGLAACGFDPALTVQNAATNNWILFAYYGGYAIQAVSIILIMIFFNVEKKIPQVHAELKERRKAAVLTRGGEWIDEDELERRQRESAERIAEENRIKDLREKCARKGLDFDAENDKYIKKKAEKAAKRMARAKKEGLD